MESNSVRKGMETKRRNALVKEHLAGAHHTRIEPCPLCSPVDALSAAVTVVSDWPPYLRDHLTPTVSEVNVDRWRLIAAVGSLPADNESEQDLDEAIFRAERYGWPIPGVVDNDARLDQAEEEDDRARDRWVDEQMDLRREDEMADFYVNVGRTPEDEGS